MHLPKQFCELCTGCEAQLHQADDKPVVGPAQKAVYLEALAVADLELHTVDHLGRNQQDN